MPNNDEYIKLTAQLDTKESKKIIDDQLKTLEKELTLNISKLLITDDGVSSLQSELNRIQNSLQLNINTVNINQAQVAQQAQNVANQLNSTINKSMGTNSSADNIKRAFDISGNVASKLKKRYTDIAVLASDLQKRFKSVGEVTTEVLSRENRIIDGFRATITNADGAVEKLTFHLQQIEGTKKHEWALTGSSANDNNIKLQEQALKEQERQIKANEQATRRFNSELTSSVKILTNHSITLGNLSKSSIFGKNASANEVKALQDQITTLTDRFKQVRADFDKGLRTEKLKTDVSTLDADIIKTIKDAQQLSTELTANTTNVIHEEEINKLNTLMNQIKASKVETQKFEQEYQNLEAVLASAKLSGNYTDYFNQLAVFKSKFAEAKSEINATETAVAELSAMAKQLQSNKLNNFFSRNEGNLQVETLKTEIAGLITEWETLNQDIKATTQITPELQERITGLKTRMDDAAKSATTLQNELKANASQVRLTAQRSSLSNRITEWLNNNTRASRKTVMSLQELQAQIQSANTQDMQNLNNQFREITTRATQAGEAGKKFGDVIREKMGKFVGWFSISQIVMKTVRYMRELWTTVKELDTALVDLRKTTDGTNSELEQFYLEANKIGKELGVTTKEVISAAAEWSRLGLT